MEDQVEVLNEKDSKANENIDLIKCLNYSNKFKSILSLLDELVQNDNTLLVKLCSNLNIDNLTEINIYETKAKNNQNFLALLFEDCYKKNKFNNFDQIVEFLSQLKETKYIQNSLLKFKTEIINEINQNLRINGNFSIRVSLIDNRDGSKIEFLSSDHHHPNQIKERTVSESSVKTDSSIDSNRQSQRDQNQIYLAKVNVLLVYHEDQLKHKEDRINKFKKQLEKSNINLIDLDLAKKSTHQIELEFQKSLPVFLIYDKKIDEIINDRRAKSNDLKYAGLHKFYTLIYKEYLTNNSVNRRFYTFILENYSDYKIEYSDGSSASFRYKWLLRNLKILKQNSDKKMYAKPYEIPYYLDNEENDPNIEKFLLYFEKDRLFF